MSKSSLVAIVLCLALAISLVGVGQVNAQALDLQALVRQLQEQVKALQAQVVSLQAQLTTTKEEVKTTREEVAEVKAELKITRSLERGATGDEVKELQEFLKNFPDIYPSGLVTGYFGPQTELAVRKLQEKQGIEAVGIVGPKTLAKINELLTEGTGASGKVPPGLMRALGIQTKLVATTTRATVTATTTTILPPVPAPTSTLIVPTTTTTATTTEAVATTTAAYVPPVTTPSTGQTTAPAAPAAPATVSSQSPIFTITSPNGGEGWTVGETKAITWTAGGVSVSTVNVELLKSGSYIGMLGYNVANTGSLNWTIASSVAAGSDYKVKIYNPSSLYYTYFDESDSSFSIVVPADTTPPGAPASIGASASTSTKIYLQWETSIDNVGVSGYKIYRDGSYLTSVAPLSYANSFTDTGLSPSTTHSYTVAAYDAAGNISPQSSAASATTQSAVMPPAAPSDFNLTSNNGLALGLRWVDNSGDETEFRMERRSRPNYDNEVGASPWAEIGSVAANSTTYTDSNFPATGIYDYRVKACNSAGCSAVSTSVNGMLMQKSAFAPAEKNLASIMYSLSEILLKLQGLLR